MKNFLLALLCWLVVPTALYGVGDFDGNDFVDTNLLDPINRTETTEEEYGDYFSVDNSDDGSGDNPPDSGNATQPPSPISTKAPTVIGGEGAGGNYGLVVAPRQPEEINQVSTDQNPVVSVSPKELQINSVYEENKQLLSQLQDLNKQMKQLGNTKADLLEKYTWRTVWGKLKNLFKTGKWQYPDRPGNYLDALEKAQSSLVGAIQGITQKTGNLTSDDVNMAEVLFNVLLQEQAILKTFHDQIGTAEAPNTQLFPDANQYDIAQTKTDMNNQNADLGGGTWVDNDGTEQVAEGDSVLGSLKIDLQIINQRFQEEQKLSALPQATRQEIEQLEKPQEAADAALLKTGIIDQLLGWSKGMPANVADVVGSTRITASVIRLIDSIKTNINLKTYVIAFKARYIGMTIDDLRVVQSTIAPADASFDQQILAAFKEKLFEELIAFKRLPFDQQKTTFNVFGQRALTGIR